MTTTTLQTAGRKETPTSRLLLSVDAPRTDWLEARRLGIAATDLPAILGQNSYRTAYDVWTSKILPPPDDDQAGEAAFWGTRLEEPVAQAWADKHGVKIRRIGIVSNEANPWMLASLDRLVTGCPDGRCALEIKTRSLFVSDTWEAGIPEDVKTQVAWQLIVTGLDHVHVAALIGGQRLVEHRVNLSEVDANQLTGPALLVWQAVQANTPPDLPPELWTADYLDQRHQERSGVIQVAPETSEILNDYQRITQDLKHLESQRDLLKVQLIGLLGDGEIAESDGVTLYTYKAQNSRRLDSKKLLAAYPGIEADKQVWNTTTSRVLRITTKKEGSTK